MALNDSRFQMALARDPQFLNRVQYLMCRIAANVVAEAGTVPSHAARRAFAAQVLGNPTAAAASFAVGLVGAINLISRDTTVNPDFSVTTSATDAEIENQISTLWNQYAGV